MIKSPLFFPSGRSVDRCKQDAKALVKSSKKNNSPILLHEALDQIAQANGSSLPWPEAIKQLKKKKKPKVAQIHLLGHALNLLIEKGLIDMNSSEDAKNGYLESELLGKPTVLNWCYIGHGEIRLSVWWNFDKTKHPQHLEGGFKNLVLLDNLKKEERSKYWGKNTAIHSTDNAVEKYHTPEPLAKTARYKEFVGVLCSTWIERKTGKYLQTKDGKGIFGSYIRNKDKEKLVFIPDCSPLGFTLNGKKIF
ncbi:hypothetical protein EHQ81_10495 [Leptospira selangorensis]|uniref:Uncharacterized protein n=1 Tax=Leptospira selangorensis TaxID=2484982 RepID=A0A5F2C3K8_9LEPT|nr:hypothetical protein [Leptospira selangorensis]TGM13264.1 hypothetical protein EHQ81_10495 [Leptospira selangorensis]TGM22394.1 hypothetical protein EHQ82_08230 [Leptospira selangorensis]